MKRSICFKYPDRSAGGIMTTEFVRLDPAMTVAQALAYIRTVARERETIYACYVLDSAARLARRAVAARSGHGRSQPPVTDVMRRNPLTVGVLDDREDCRPENQQVQSAGDAGPRSRRPGRRLRDGGRRHRRLVEEQTEDVLRMGAVEPGALDEPYLATPLAAAGPEAGDLAGASCFWARC